MNHDEAQELLGAYAVDAVPPDEAQAVSAHVSGCPACQEELRDFRQVAAELGPSGPAAPPEIWDRIALQLGDASPPLRPAQPGDRGRGGRVASALSAAAVVAALAIAGLGWEVSHLNGRIGQLQAEVSKSGIAQAAGAAALKPHSRSLELSSPSGSLTAHVVIAAGGQGYLVASNLPVLRPSKTYQLWGLSGQSAAPVSLGLLGQVPAPAAFRVDARVKELAISAEPLGGSVAPTAPVLVHGAV
jgi:anti-sigma-K factor RskA